MHTFRTVSLAIVTIVITVSLVFFGISNSEVVTVKFFGWEAHYPLCVQLFFSAVSGALVTSLIALVEVVRLQSRLRRARHQRQMLEREIDALRNQPLFDEPQTSEKKDSQKTDLGLEDQGAFDDLPKSLKRENLG